MSVSPESSAHGLVIHVWLVLVKSPQSGDRFAVHDLKDAPVSVQPLDVVRTVRRGLKQREEELPEVRIVVVLRSPLYDLGVVWFVMLRSDWRF